MQLGCFGFHRQIYPQEGDSKKKWKIEIFGKFDMPTEIYQVLSINSQLGCLDKEAITQL